MMYIHTKCGAQNPQNHRVAVDLPWLFHEEQPCPHLSVSIFEEYVLLNQIQDAALNKECSPSE